jgi:phosphoribosylamine---glycine ligase
MKVLLLGSGAREHALAWAIAKSPKLTKLYVAPGNPGTEALGESVAIDHTDPQQVVNKAKELEIELVVIGPEASLLTGVGSILEFNNIPVFGPTSGAAQIEASKIFAKRFMTKFKIPTSPYGTFENLPEALQYVRNRNRPMVVKADGAVQGKGVFVCDSAKEAEVAVRLFMESYSFGRAGRRIVIEDRLQGKEVSLFALTDGEKAWLLPPVRDHKTLLDGNKGPQTGGMGAYTPVADISFGVAKELFDVTIRPAIDGLQREGRAFRGILYAGIMMTDSGPRVLEYNCRFGDPEAQAILPLAKFDWLYAFWQAAVKNLEPEPPKDAWESGATCAVVVAAEGYPGNVVTGDTITGLEGDMTFYAGVKREGGKLVTSGGRVATVVGRGVSLLEARQRAYQAAERIQFRGKQLRSDIGA